MNCYAEKDLLVLPIVIYRPNVQTKLLSYLRVAYKILIIIYNQKFFLYKIMLNGDYIFSLYVIYECHKIF